MYNRTERRRRSECQLRHQVGSIRAIIETHDGLLLFGIEDDEAYAL